MSRRPWSKAAFLGVYWAVQAGAAFFLWPVLLLDASFSDLRHVINQWQYVACMSAVLLGIMGAQGVLLMPVRKPGVPGGNAGRGWTPALMGGLAVGGMTLYATLLLWQALDALNIGRQFLQQQQDGTVFIPAMLVTPIAAVSLRWAYPGGMPAWLSMCISACLAASLAMGLVLGLFSLVTVMSPAPGTGGNDAGSAGWFVAAAGVFFLSWAVATPLLIAFCRKRGRESAVTMIASRLFLGTIVEAGAMIPLDVMVRRKASCYCDQGTMWALTICWGVGTVALGPAIWLVPLSRRRKRWYAGHCEACGYDMRGLVTAERCPECGAGWQAPPETT